MPYGQDGDHLSWGDALFLYLEREGTPLNIASVSMFEGVIPLEACRESIVSKLPLLPRYRQRVISPPFNIGLPHWEFDPTFDVRNHVFEVTLKRGTDAEFKAVAGKILSQTMNRERPLWDLVLVRGLKGDRTGLIARIHHCLADGVAGVGLMNVVMDSSPVPRPIRAGKRSPRTRPRHHAPPSLLDGWITSYFDAVQQILSMQSDVLNVTQSVVANGANLSSEEVTRLMPEIAAPTERLSFNVICQGPEKFACTELPLEPLKAIHDACGVTLNDVVLALITATLRHYAELHGDVVKGRLLRFAVPVSFRNQGSGKDLGNRISFLPVTVPMDIRSPKRLLAAVHERTEFLKRAHVADLVGLAGATLGAIPTPLQAAVGPLVSQLPLNLCNLVCTNVPGPQVPLYVLGHKMLSWYPYVPIGGEMGLNCAILTYNGTAYFGFTGDAHAAPDLWRMERLLKLSFLELGKTTSGSSPRKKRVRPKAKPVPGPIPVIHIDGSSSIAPPVAGPERHRPKTAEEKVLIPLAS
jgi:diacylglycerol O-acyltransferase / wax synthase